MASITWRNHRKFKPEFILSKLDGHRIQLKNGRTGFQGLGFEEMVPALQVMLKLSPQLDGIDMARIVFKALLKAPTPLTCDGFLSAANSVLKEQLSTREVDYRILTTISIKRNSTPQSIKLENATINFFEKFPKKYNGRIELIKKVNEDSTDSPSEFTRVVISVRAKSPKAAIHTALKALDLQRALWCLYGNFSMEMNYGKQSDNPINRIRLGEHHTLHYPNGNPYTDGSWYEPNYCDAKPFCFEEPTSKKRLCTTQRSRIKRHLDKEKINSALLRYVRALDERDMNSAFLRIWSVIESLTGDGSADHEKLVRRCAFLFTNHEYHYQMLEYLKVYRNDSVHASEYLEEARTVCYQAQNYFRALVNFYLRMAKILPTITEANQFLDLPADKRILADRIKITQEAIRFRTPRPIKHQEFQPPPKI